MPSLPSRTSVKLIGGFLAILLLFFLAAVLTFRSVRDVEQSNADMEKIAEAVRTGRMMTDIVRDQYIQLSQFVISRDWKYEAQFWKLGLRMKSLKEQVARQLGERVATQPVWSEDEKEVIQRLMEQHSKFEDVYNTDLSQAVKENNIDKVYRIRRQSESLLEQVVLLNANLEQMFLTKLKRAQARQAAVAAWAKRSPFIFFGVAVLLSLLIVVYLGRSIADPIRKLIRGTKDIARGDLTARIQLNRRDEFGRLAESFNRMTQELREHQQRIIQSEKMASLGQLAAGVAHEINNPIGVILGYIKLLLADMKPGDRYYEDLKAMEEEACQCQRIVSQLRHFSRPTELTIEVVDVREVADEALARISRAGKEPSAPIIVTKDYGAGVQLVAADRGKLREVLLNIVQNAADAMPNGGEIKVSIRRAPGGGAGGEPRRAGAANAEPERGELVLIDVADTGCGIPEENMKRVFEPFFSTKERGMGLGLAISYAIMKAHKGFIEVKSEPGKSATFTIGIPAADGTASAPVASARTPPREQVSHDS